MEVFKIIGVGLIGAIIAVFLKQSKSEFSIFVVLATGLIILIMILNSLEQVVLSFNGIVDKSGISSKMFEGLLKIVGIGYVTEYAANICTDFECSSIGKKIQFGGKVAIFLMSMPIITSLIDTIAKITL